MTRDHGLRLRTMTLPAGGPSRPIPPILIRVPALPGPSRRPVHRLRPRRRRLRREVRMAGYALLTAMPLALAATLLWGGRPAVSSTPGRGAIAADRPPAARSPAISISIDPMALAPYAEAEAPVVLPGYLLPDDNAEEAAHAGS